MSKICKKRVHGNEGDSLPWTRKSVLGRSILHYSYFKIINIKHLCLFFHSLPILLDFLKSPPRLLNLRKSSYPNVYFDPPFIRHLRVYALYRSSRWDLKLWKLFTFSSQRIFTNIHCHEMNLELGCYTPIALYTWTYRLYLYMSHVFLSLTMRLNGIHFILIQVFLRKCYFPRPTYIIK